MVRHWVRSIATLLVLVAGATLGAAAPARADGIWFFGDGFEQDAESTWWFDGSPDVLGGIYSNQEDGPPHTGSRYADVDQLNPDVDQTNPGWAGVARTIHLTPAESHPIVCGAKIWLQQAPGTQVNIEVIDPASWTYLALRQVTLPSDFQWHSYSTPSWRPGPIDVVFRVSVIQLRWRNRVKVDDLMVVCSDLP